MKPSTVGLNPLTLYLPNAIDRQANVMMLLGEKSRAKRINLAIHFVPLFADMRLVKSLGFRNHRLAVGKDNQREANQAGQVEDEGDEGHL